MRLPRSNRKIRILTGTILSLSLAVGLSLTSFAKDFNGGQGPQGNGGQGMNMPQNTEMQQGPGNMQGMEKPDGEMPQGEMPNGEMPDGEKPEGDFKPADGEEPPAKPDGDLSFNDISGGDVSFNDISFNDVSSGDISYNEPRKADPVKDTVTKIVEDSDDDETLITRLVNWVKSLFSRKKKA